MTSAGFSWAMSARMRSRFTSGTSQSKTYGDTFTFDGTEFTQVGLVTANGDTLTGVTLTSDGAAKAATVAGSDYAITITKGSETGNRLDNYDIHYTD